MRSSRPLKVKPSVKGGRFGKRKGSSGREWGRNKKKDSDLLRNPHWLLQAPSFSSSSVLLKHEQVICHNTYRMLGLLI
jgi:hypothetical protein